MADPEKVSQLIELGLNPNDAAAALIKTGNDLEQAIALIFEEPRSIKPAESDQDMQEAIAQSLLTEGVSRDEFCGFSTSITTLSRNADEPLAMEELKEWPILGYVLLALAEVDGISEVLSESNNTSVWSKAVISSEEESLSSKLLLNFSEQQDSNKKYGSPSDIGNHLVSKTKVSFPCSVTETMNAIRAVLMQESSDEKASKIKRITSLPILRESISSTTDYISALEMSPFHHDEDLRLWLSKSLAAPKTFLFPHESSQKLMVLSFPQLANIRIPLELYIDRHLKKNSFIMGPKDRELLSKESELYKIESRKKDISISSISECINFVQKHPKFGSPSMLSKLYDYRSAQTSRIQDLNQESLLIRRRMSDIFEVPALLKENLKAFGILTFDEAFSFYLLKSNIWWKFTDKNVVRVEEDVLLELKNISCVWYRSLILPGGGN